jgi:alpha-galactosidase
LTSLQHSIQKLLVEAYARESRKLLLQALLLDPVVDSLERARRLADAMLELQSEHLLPLR